MLPALFPHVPIASAVHRPYDALTDLCSYHDRLHLPPYTRQVVPTKKWHLGFGIQAITTEEATLMHRGLVHPEVISTVWIESSPTGTHLTAEHTRTLLPCRHRVCALPVALSFHSLWSPRDRDWPCPPPGSDE